MAETLNVNNKNSQEKRPRIIVNRKAKPKLVYDFRKESKPKFQNQKYQNSQEWKKQEDSVKEDQEIREFKNNRNKEKEGHLNRALELLEKIFKVKSKENYSENFLKAVELLKTKQIKEVIVAGSFANPNEPSIDFDSRGALNLLNNYNQKSYTETYAESAKTTVLNQEELNKYFKNLKKQPKDDKGIIVIIDASGNWLKVFNEDNSKETILAIDHHGQGEAPETSGTKLTYSLMKRAGILKEEYWMKDYVKAINNIDNLNYLDKRDRDGNLIFNKEYFLNSWTRSLAAFAEQEIPFEELEKLFREGKIKDISRPLNYYELNGELGNIEVNIKVGPKNYKKMPLREAVKIKQRDARNSLKSAEEILKDNYRNYKLTESKDLGNVLYQDYKSKRKMLNGNEITNKIDNRLAFKVLKAMGGNTYIVWNQDKGYFYINSDYPEADLQLLAEVFNYKYPGSANEVRGRFIFGKFKNLNEERFLDIIKNYKRIAEEINKKDDQKDKVRLAEKEAGLKEKKLREAESKSKENLEVKELK